MRNKLLIYGLVIGLIVGSVVGSSLGYILRKSPLDAAVTTSTPTSAKKITLSTVPIGSPGVTGELEADNGQAFVTAVMSDMTDRIAVGLAQAVQDNPNATAPTAGLIDKIIKEAQAASCLDVANAAIKKSLAYWLPSGAGQCAQITGSYKADYVVNKSGTDSQFFKGAVPIKVTLQATDIVLLWKDPSCNTKTTPLNISPVTRYYSARYDIFTGEMTTELVSITKTKYEYLINLPGTKIWCAGTASDGIKIGNIAICPRCDKKGNSGRP